MTCLCPDFELRGRIYEIHTDRGERYLVDVLMVVVDTDHAFEPPLTNEELLSIYNYGKDY